MAEYKKVYEVFAHKKREQKVNGLYKLFSEYIEDFHIVYAREQFKRKYPDYVIDLIQLSNWYKK